MEAPCTISNMNRHPGNIHFFDMRSWKNAFIKSQKSFNVKVAQVMGKVGEVQVKRIVTAVLSACWAETPHVSTAYGASEPKWSCALRYSSIWCHDEDQNY